MEIYIREWEGKKVDIKREEWTWIWITKTILFSGFIVFRTIVTLLPQYLRPRLLSCGLTNNLYELPTTTAIDSKDRIFYTYTYNRTKRKEPMKLGSCLLLDIPSSNNLMHMQELKRLISPHWFYIVFMALYWVKYSCFQLRGMRYFHRIFSLVRYKKLEL